jgi:hypothetical protein
MKLNVDRELALLRGMTTVQLRRKYAEVFKEQTRSGHKDWLVKRIIWRLQALAEGDLSERARQRALEIANDADLRVMAPHAATASDSKAPIRETAAGRNDDDRLPRSGSVITRDYKGQALQVLVQDKGFEFEGIVYRTLSAVAKKITGTHTNGFLFFRLGDYGGGR